MEDRRELPHSIEGERAVLGAIMLDNDVMFDVMEIIEADDFFASENAELYKLMRDLIEAERAVTPQTLLADKTQDRDIGYGVLASKNLNDIFAEGVPRTAAIELAKAIQDNALTRRLILTARQMIEDAHERPASMRGSYLRDLYDARFGALFPSVKELGIRHIADYGDELLTRVDEAAKTEVDPGLALGMKEAQDLIGALLPGRLYAVAGASGSGKSAITQQWLEYITAPREDGKPSPVALWIQAEMEGEEVAGRAFSGATGVTGEKIERAMINDQEFDSLVDANRQLRRHSLYVDTATLPTVAKIRSRAVRFKRKIGLHVLVVDHLIYLGKPNDRMEEIQAIPYNMRELKALAKDLHIPVVVLMPLKSAYHDGDLRQPRMSDLTHPAAIDQNSDAILFVSRPEFILGRNEVKDGEKDFAKYLDLVAKWKGKGELILNKRRGGKGYGSRTVWFDEDRARFSDNQPRSVRIAEPVPAFDFGGS